MTQEVDDTSDPVCQLCGVPYAGHLKCQCCSIYCGPNHFQEKVYHYRGKTLCGLCIKAWIHFEKVVGYNVAWDAFLNRNKYYQADGQRRRKKVS